MPDLVLNCAGTTRTTGTADPVITGTTGTSGDPRVDLADGQEVSYYRRYKSGKAGYENGIGNWRTATNSIDRSAIEKSSNNNAAVSWGSGEQIVDITANVQMLTDMDNMVESATKKILTVAERNDLLQFQEYNIFVNKPDGEDIVIVASGQSQMGNYGYYRTGDPWPEEITHPNVTYWDRDGIPGSTNYAFRQKTIGDTYTLNNIGNEITVGFQTGDPNYPGFGMSTPTFQMAIKLANVTGRRVRVIQAFRGAANIDSLEAGWGWDDEPNTASVLNDAVGAAITALRLIPGNENAKPDVFLWVHQSISLDVVEPQNVNTYYGNRLLDFIRNSEDPARWGWANKNMIWLFSERPTNALDPEALVNTWHGMENTINAIGPERGRIISTQGDSFIPTGEFGAISNIHWDSPAQDLISLRCFDALMKPKKTAERLPGMVYRRNFRTPDKDRMPYPLKFEGISETAPASGFWNYNLAGTKLRLSSQTPDGFDWPEAGLHRFESGFFGMEKVGTPGINRLFLLSSRSAYVRNSYIEWTGSLILQPGVLNTNDLCYVGGGADIYDDKQGVLYTEADIVRQASIRTDINFLNNLGFQIDGPFESVGVSNSKITTTPQGATIPTGTIHTRHKLTTVGATATSIIDSVLPVNTSWGYSIEWNASKSDFTAGAGATIRGMMMKQGAGASTGPAGLVYGKTGTPASPTAIQSAGSMIVQVAGIAVETWVHTVDVFMWPIGR